VHDAVARRHDADPLESLLAPLEERVALAVPLEFLLHVALDRVRAAAHVDFHRVVDDQIDRHERLDALGFAAELLRGVTHRGEVVERGETRHVLEQDAREHERDLRSALGRGLPRRELAHVFLRHPLAVAVPKHRFEDDAQGMRHARNLSQPGGLERGQRVVLPFAAFW
jgi:hypothetical protein